MASLEFLGCTCFVYTIYLDQNSRRLLIWGQALSPTCPFYCPLCIIPALNLTLLHPVQSQSSSEKMQHTAGSQPHSRAQSGKSSMKNAFTIFDIQQNILKRPICRSLRPIAVSMNLASHSIPSTIKMPQTFLSPLFLSIKIILIRAARALSYAVLIVSNRQNNSFFTVLRLLVKARHRVSNCRGE